MVCVGLSERDLLQRHDVTRKIFGGTLEGQAKFGGAVAPRSTPVAPPLVANVVFPGQMPKAVFPANERKYTTAGGDVQVPRDGIHEWQKS